EYAVELEIGVILLKMRMQIFGTTAEVIRSKEVQAATDSIAKPRITIRAQDSVVLERFAFHSANSKATGCVEQYPVCSEAGSCPQRSKEVHGLADPQDIVAVRDTHSPFPIEEVYVRERAKNEIVLELVIVADVDTTDDGASLLVVEEGKIRCGNSVLISQIEALVPVFDSQRCGLCIRRFTDSE